MGAPLPSRGPADGYPPYRPRSSGLRWVFLGVAGAIVVLGAVLLLAALSPGTFGLSRGPGYLFGGGFLGIFLIFWGVLLIVRVAWWFGRYRRRGGPRFDPAVLEARRRYARGEITREQFHQILTDLRGPRGPPP